jgi:hypothetical protein
VLGSDVVLHVDDEADGDAPHGCPPSDREYTASFAALSGMVDLMDASNPVARTSNPARQS